MQNKSGSNSKNYTTLKTLSPSRRSVRSITNCHSGSKAHKPQKNVTYGELQIILENVQAIKNKASDQIKHLERRNAILEDEVNRAKEILEMNENKEERKMKEQRKVEQEMKEGLLKTEKMLSHKERQINQMKRIEEELKSELDQANEEVIFKNKIIKQLEESKIATENKYTCLISALNINETDEETEFIRREYGGVKKLLTHFEKLKTQKQYLVTELQRELEGKNYLKENLVECTKIIDKMTEENQLLINRIQSQQKQVRQLQLQGYAKQQAHRNEIKAKEDQYEMDKGLLQQRIDEIVRQIGCKEEEYRGLNEELLMLKEKIEIKEREESILKEELIFKKMVDEACNQQSDYENVIKRVEYLEKYKNEYYYNIEKIQFLCRMLDY